MRLFFRWRDRNRPVEGVFLGCDYRITLWQASLVDWTLVTAITVLFAFAIWSDDWVAVAVTCIAFIVAFVLGSRNT